MDHVQNDSVINDSIADNTKKPNAKKNLQSWYDDKFQSILIQRNIAFIIFIISIIVVVVSVIIVGHISTSKSFEPFVIQINEKTGLTQIVNPIETDLISGNEAIARYFVKKYVVARETYNAVDYETNMKKVVKLLSTPNIYRNYLGYIRNPVNNLAEKYADHTSTYLQVRSWSKLDNDTYILRFSISESSGSKNIVYKIAVVSIEYVPMELSQEDSDINPVGFRVTGYRIDQDNS